jgi:hypothetical protein
MNTMHCQPIDLHHLARLWKSELRSDQICVELGCTRGHLFNLARKHRLGRRPPKFNAPRTPETPDPTESEIAEMTAAIRATWTDQERRSRMVGCHRKHVEVPNFHFHREHYVFSY